MLSITWPPSLSLSPSLPVSLPVSLLPIINHPFITFFLPQVGWEVASTVNLLKTSGTEIVMVMKAGLLHTHEEKIEAEEINNGIGRDTHIESTNGIAADESCDSLDCLPGSSDNSLDIVRRVSISAESDSDVVSSPDVVVPMRKNLHRTASNPLLDGKGGGAMGGARRLSDSLDFDESDGGIDHGRLSKITILHKL